jgi:hypothetical protein
MSRAGAENKLSWRWLVFMISAFVFCVEIVFWMLEPRHPGATYLHVANGSYVLEERGQHAFFDRWQQAPLGIKAYLEKSQGERCYTGLSKLVMWVRSHREPDHFSLSYSGDDRTAHYQAKGSVLTIRTSFLSQTGGRPFLHVCPIQYSGEEF